MVDRIGAGRPYQNVEQTQFRRLSGERSKRAARQAGETSAKRDEVEISEEAMRMRGATEAVAEAPEVRRQLVERLRQDIASGSYRVDSHEVARRVVDVIV